MFSSLTRCGAFSGNSKSGLKAPYISLFLLFLLFAVNTSIYSQAGISGIINSYSSVLSIEGTDAVTVSTPSLFQPGDTVLLIQMKGLGILTSPPADYGKQQNINNAGNYEFLIVSTIDQDTVRFSREFIKEYDAFETAQLIKVRGYESARVTGTLTAEPWNGETGGILAMIVTNTLTLEATIDLTGTGLRGGMPVTRSDNECSVNDPDTYGEYSFPEGSDKAGRKGEGPVTYYLDDVFNMFPIGNDFVHGRGRIATGGGGGNGRFAGGGGGANSGQGGFGGDESDDCAESGIDPDGIGGINGFRLTDQLIDPLGNFTNRFIMAGGGGGSTQFGERLASPGGRGGGMVIIVANYLEGSEEFGIYADGGSVTQIATAGAGGGGGGGTIVSSVDNYTGNINLFARGGKGGDVDHEIIAGPGGGGGGGTIIYSGSSLPSQVSTDLLAGGGGTNLYYEPNDPNGSTIGSNGALIGGLEISLNGLLFNGIQIEDDIICEETAPGLIEGTQPRGGITPYFFEWFEKTEGGVWTLINGATGKDYQSPPLFETTRFLRVVKDDDPDPVIDTSRYLTITVQPKIIGNLISEEQTICEGDTPLQLTGPAPVQGGTGTFGYQWIRFTESAGEWNDAPGVNTNLNYDPPPLSDTTLFIRRAASGACIDSSNLVPVNVHPEIHNNLLGDGQTICNGDTPLPLSSPDPVTGGTGAGTYNYAWEINTDGTWNSIATGGNNAVYEPGALFDTTLYRRTVESGVCTDISPPLTVYVLDVISGNTISGNQTICYLTAPSLFEGAQPGGGDGIYTYAWESSADAGTWTSADGENGNMGYLSPALSDTLYFRRVVLSGSGDACKDTSNIVVAEFHPLSYAELIQTTDTICSGEQSELRFALSGEGPWNLTFTDGIEDFTTEGISTLTYNALINPSSSDSANYVYEIKTLADRFGCIAPAEHIDGTASVRVYAYPVPDPGTGGEVCGPVFQLNSSPSFGRGLWEALSGPAQFIPGATDPAAVVTADNYGVNEFRWTETNWQCAAGAVISVTFYEQPAEAYAGEDQDLHYLFETYMEAEIPLEMTSAFGTWELLEGTGNILFPDDPNTLVTDMGFGENIFIWTLYNGVCEPVSDVVEVTIRDLEAPTGFSPNNSGFNDQFVIKGLENSAANEITIFNRQGNVVYRAVNYQNDWEGRNQNGIPLPEDTYYYILSVDNQYSYKGFIVLKR